MIDTESDAPAADAGGNLDTLTAQDAAAGETPAAVGPLDEQLLHRDVKARLFGRHATVRVGRYEVLDRIGRGGMGTVYLARDQELSRNVALKLLRADRTAEQPRMLTEARALARLSHPNVVTVHEVGTHDDRVFVAMEYIEGQTLRQWLGTEPSRAEIFDVFAQAGRGLQAAHEAGLVHRDFKPDNVLLGQDGRVRVVDFGVAKAEGVAEPPAVVTEAGDVTLTHTGQLLGTPAYMAPEQFLGEPVDARTDVFAFCVALYEALEGQRPDAGEDPQSIAYARLTGRPRPISAKGLPRALVALIEAGVQREPSARPRSLTPIVEALGAGIDPGPRRRPVLAGAVAMAMGVLGVVGMRMLSPAEPAEATAAAASAGPAADGADDEGGDGAGEAPDAASLASITAVLDAPDEAARVEAARAHLERFGDTGDPIHRAIAHSILGDAAWRASCPEPDQGLCIRELPVPDHHELCLLPLRGPYVQVERSPDAVARARTHLEAAVALAGVNPPRDETLAAAFGEAIARARVELADAELEHYVTRPMPQGIDGELSEEAFGLFFRDHMQDANALMSAYKQVKGLDPAWAIAAAERSARVYEGTSEVLMLVPVPQGADKGAYCKSLAEAGTDRARMGALRAYQWCDEQARQSELTELPLARRCRERAEFMLGHL